MPFGDETFHLSLIVDNDECIHIDYEGPKVAWAKEMFDDHSQLNCIQKGFTEFVRDGPR